MSDPFKIDINLNEEFEHLRRAPIVEAVIDIRARATKNLEENRVRSQIEERLHGYYFTDYTREFEQTKRINTESSLDLMVQDTVGVRFRSTDQAQVALFYRYGFAFSRLEPYQNWIQFSTEGVKLWHLYTEVAQPATIHRLGLRFINRIPLAPGDICFEDYLNLYRMPEPPRGLNLPLASFMYQDTLMVPGHPYQIKRIQAIQPPAKPQEGFSLILDIDVMTIPDVELSAALIEEHLTPMKWLKNKVFFKSITEKALEAFR